MQGKTLFLFGAASLFACGASAQSGFFDRVSRSAASATERAINRKVDKSVDDAVNGDHTLPKRKPREDGRAAAEAEPTDVQRRPVTAPKPVKSTQASDFVPGTQILYAEDFHQDVTGEFPLKWFTKSSGETAELEGIAGKWLRMMPDGSYLSPMIAATGNFSVEFDVVTSIPVPGRYRPSDIGFELLDNGAGKKALSDPGFRIGNSFGFTLHPYPERSQLHAFANTGGRESFTTPVIGVNGFQEKNGSIVHVAIHVQQTRARIWFDGKKVLDAPDAVPQGVTFNQLRMTMSGTSYSADEIAFYVSNFRVGTAAADTRSKLITEGRFSTTGITFAVNSDAIAPASAPVLKEIADALKQEPSMRVRIIGHTDSDGEDAKNLELSRKRAVAVRAALGNDYGIAGDRLQTEGKGEASPVADNATTAGKAANRRVEFIRL